MKPQKNLMNRAKVNCAKGISELISAVMLFVIVMVSIFIVLSVARPTIEAGTASIDVKNAEDIMLAIDNAIREVASEGFNASRVITFTAPKTFETLPEEDAIQFKTTLDAGVSGADYLSRIRKNNIILVGGSDVRCAEEDGNSDNATDIVIENSFIKAVFTLVVRVTPNAALNTSDNIISMNEKSRNTTVTFTNSSIVIGGNLSSSTGTGFSELSINGTNLPHCQARFFVNTTDVDYDVYYKLYAGADFIVADVRNIR